MKEDALKKKLEALLGAREKGVRDLLDAIHAQLPALEKLLAEVEGHWGMEDGFYRFYHQSFKVYRMQQVTSSIVVALAALRPGQPLNQWFQTIVEKGTGHVFDVGHNRAWLKHTRPIVEALFHAHYFLKMVCKYGRELEAPPEVLPSGWAAVLYLYDLR